MKKLCFYTLALSILTMTVQAQSKDWKTLFDGKSLKGWRMYKNRPNNSWVIENGLLHCLPKAQANQRADLITTDQYDNFELSLDWKIGPHGNSGIMFHVTEQYEQPYLSGPEYQLLDDPSYEGQITATQHTGANYAMQAASKDMTKPRGEWNHTRILVKGPHVEHWLNGEKIVSYELWSPEWYAQKAKDKWKDAPAYGMAPTGYISLQDHGEEIWFRNIRIRKL